MTAVDNNPATVTPTADCPGTDTEVLQQYPSSVSGPITVVAPENTNRELTRAKRVLGANSGPDATTDRPVISHGTLSLDGDRSLVVLAPKGDLPDVLDGEIPFQSSGNESTVHASISVYEHPRNSSTDIIVVSGGSWGIRAAADALTNRGQQTFGSCGNITASISMYSGEVSWSGTPPTRLTFSPNDSNEPLFVAVGTPQLHPNSTNASVTATVRGYRTTANVTEFVAGETRQTAVPAIEVVSVESSATTSDQNQTGS